MRIERWYWLPIFCAVSLFVHIVAVRLSPSLASQLPNPKTAEIEVSLAPHPEPPKPEQKKEPPKPPVTPEPKKERPKQESPIKAPPEKHIAKAKPERGVPFDPKVTKRPVVIAKNVPTAPNAEPGGNPELEKEVPLPSGLPSGKRDAGMPRLTRMAKAEIKPGGGGSPAPDPNLTGKGGAAGPEAPPEDILYAGGGAGGINLPRVAPRMGGGGGLNFLAVQNPLAKDAVPDDRPGLGPGKGGAAGAGAGGGVGYARDKGIGTRLDGGPALATLRAKPGIGIGAGKGDKIGTNPPGGGKGTGAELPGTGGTGLGYGRGSGIGVGNGSGVGVGDGSGGPVGRIRGVPFGDVAGILGGDPNGGGGKGGGPGGPGRGGVFGKLPGGGGGGGKVHIVYVLDISGSMQLADKIGRAKTALKKALSELKPGDTFNVLAFARDVYGLSDEMVQATKVNVESASEYVDGLRLRPNTNISAAMQVALSFEKVTHVYLLTDGEPETGIRDFEELRKFIQEKNTSKAHINTLAIGIGETFRGMQLLKAVASENDGLYGYVDVTKLPGSEDR
jgi:hypothetical protein